mgnify:CR=1 FL=1
MADSGTGAENTQGNPGAFVVPEGSDQKTPQWWVYQIDTGANCMSSQ